MGFDSSRNWTNMEYWMGIYCIGVLLTFLFCIDSFHHIKAYILLYVNNIVLLRKVFHIGLVIGPRKAIMDLGVAEVQYG